MFEFRRLLCSALLTFAALASSASAFAQDLVAVAPKLAKVEYEDARVRIVRLRIPAHASVATHDRPRRVVVSLTPNHARLTRVDGTTSVTRTEAGSVAWSEPAVRSVLNLGAVVENIVVELKQADAPGTSVANGPPAPTPDDLSDPRHRWVFENQYVRVYDVRIPSGESTTVHRHAYDQVTVYVSGGVLSTQQAGQPWARPNKIKPRSIAYAGNSGKPIDHRVRNDGSNEFHAILVQFLK